MNWNRYKRESTDGRALCKLDEVKFWQSRMTVGGKVAEAPELTDLEQLAKSIRSAE